ncbi:MAG: phospholipase A [Alistipes sp.]|nr:phospholipase A [Alistipes sp.]
MRYFATILFAIIFSLSASAKSGDSVVVKQKSRYPVIGMWKQNYIATGFATNQPVSKFSSDIKFQLSLALRLWNIKGKVDILTTYSQRSIWNVYQESCPFLETAYNPGLWVAWQTNEKVRLLFGIEHESNGLDGDKSRSFNYATVACLYEPHPNWILGARAWYGYYGREHISRYYHYRGVMQLWGTFHTRNDRFSVTALVNPTVTFTRYNLQVEAAWRMAKRGDWIPSIFVQYCYGYGETMIDYNRRTSKIRLGISLMNSKMNLY